MGWGSGGDGGAREVGFSVCLGGRLCLHACVVDGR